MAKGTETIALTKQEKAVVLTAISFFKAQVIRLNKTAEKLHVGAGDDARRTAALLADLETKFL